MVLVIQSACRKTTKLFAVVEQNDEEEKEECECKKESGFCACDNQMRV